MGLLVVAVIKLNRVDLVTGTYNTAMEVYSILSQHNDVNVMVGGSSSARNAGRFKYTN